MLDLTWAEDHRRSCLLYVHWCKFFCLSVFLRPDIVGLCLCVHVVSPLSTSQQAGIGRDVVVIMARALLRPAKSPISHLSISTVFAHLTKADLLESSKPSKPPTGVTYKKVNSVPKKQTQPSI